MALKHYVRKSDLVYLGQHGAAPKNSYEIPANLVGKKLKSETTQNDMGMDIVEISIDDTAQAIADANKIQAEEDAKYEEMRSKRDQLLAESDFTQLDDAPIDASKKAEYVTYRQELRDLPANIVDIDNFSYPSKPE